MQKKNKDSNYKIYISKFDSLYSDNQTFEEEFIKEYNDNHITPLTDEELGRIYLVYTLIAKCCNGITILLENKPIEEFSINERTTPTELFNIYLNQLNLNQSGYDYKCIYDPKTYEYTKMTPKQMYDAKLFNILAYRITYTNVDGKVFEFSTQQVKDFCDKYGLNSVKELYYGRAKDLFSNIELDQNWHDNFLQALRDKYLEKQSVLCNNKVPEEGIVLRREISEIDVYKLKSIAFLERETKMLDKGEADIV